MELKDEIYEQILINQVTIISALESLRLGVQNKWMLNERIKESNKVLDKMEKKNATNK